MKYITLSKKTLLKTYQHSYQKSLIYLTKVAFLNAKKNTTK